MTNHHHHWHELLGVAGRDYDCVFEPGTKGQYWVSCPEIPPMLAVGDTPDEARANALAELEAIAAAKAATAYDPFRELRTGWPPNFAR